MNNELKQEAKLLKLINNLKGDKEELLNMVDTLGRIKESNHKPHGVWIALMREVKAINRQLENLNYKLQGM